jgi:hypothetical protein
MLARRANLHAPGAPGLGHQASAERLGLGVPSLRRVDLDERPPHLSVERVPACICL